MINPRLLLAFLFSGVLVACSDTIEDKPPLDIPEIPLFPSQITLENTPLPIHETFNVSGPNGGIEFFDPTYRQLVTSAIHEDIEDRNGNVYTLEDTWPSFYYPTCCFFQTFPEGDPNAGQQRRPPLEDPPAFADDMDFRLKVADNRMAISNARFTVGQVVSDLTPDTAVDRKINTTNGARASLGSWGELDLTQPYRISFCLAGTGVNPPGNSNLEVYVDNNSGGNQDHSIHTQASMLLRTETVGGQNPLVAGNRLVLDVPGQVRQISNAGAEVGNPLAILPARIGTRNSFVQLRVSSGGFAVISDLVIEYQEDRTVQELVTALPCTTAPGFFVPPSPKQIREDEGLPGIAQFAGLPLNVDATAGEVDFFGQIEGLQGATATTTGNYLAISDDVYDNFYKKVGSPTRIFVDEANNAVRFGNALWTMGQKEADFQDSCNNNYIDPPCSTDTGATPNADIDLTQPYRITAEILELPVVIGYRLQVQIDNNSGTGAASVHGTASRIANLIAGDGLETGTLVINVPGEITMNGVQLTTMDGDALVDPDFAVPALVGTATSFIAFRCPSECVNTADNPQVTQDSAGIVLGDIVVEYQ